jgi:hypothetical protein
MAMDWLTLASYLCEEHPDMDDTVETAEYLVDLSSNEFVLEAPMPLTFHSMFSTGSVDALASLISAPRLV